MVDITHKISTLRSATAKATVIVSKIETIEAIVNNLVPKGNVLEMAKTAGLFAVKNTHLSIPDCHPIPIEFTAVEYKIKELSKATIRCIPLNNPLEDGKCILSGNPSTQRVLFARAY